jgi:hypothetical protein
MTLQLELTKNTEQILKENAIQHGMNPNEYATYLLEKSLKSTAGIELLEQWLNESDSAVIEEQTQTFTDLQENLDQNRADAARKLFPK